MKDRPTSKQKGSNKKELEIVQGRENILRGVREHIISTKQERYS